MHLKRVDTEPSHYVVLDVETNGKSSKRDDLLSISLYRPDNNDHYERFLPLELNSSISPEVTAINGIRNATVRSKKPLTQKAVDRLFKRFELGSRTILHYGAIDERFIREYFRRHKLIGYEQMHFYNFKEQICSPSYSVGNLSKDNLCRVYGIEGVRETHSGMNDCRLEWSLFQAMDGKYLFAKHSGFWTDIYEMSEDYIVPVSYLANRPNLSKLFTRPYIACTSEVIKRFQFQSKYIQKFNFNISGITVEHLINTMLHVEKVDSRPWLTENVKKLKYVGCISWEGKVIPVTLNEDGSVTAENDEDSELEAKINQVNDNLKQLLVPLINYIRDEIFDGNPIKSQELKVDKDQGILALCDLSSDAKILEIKTYPARPADVAEQLHYEADGRDAYLLTMEWESVFKDGVFADEVLLNIIIYKVETKPGIKVDGRKKRGLFAIKSKLNTLNLDLVSYISSTDPIKVKCRTCGNRWDESYARINAGKTQCPECHPKKATKKIRVSREELRRKRLSTYQEKLSKISAGLITIEKTSYTGTKSNVLAKCNHCGHSWQTRGDHLLERHKCPKCGAGA